jgi:hypothetical protein
MSIFSPNFKFKFKFKSCQKIKISNPKVINCHLLGDFCLANFILLTTSNLKFNEKLVINLLNGKLNSPSSFLCTFSYQGRQTSGPETHFCEV